MRRRAVPVLLALLATLASAGCGEDADPGGILTMGTGNSTGVYAVLGRGLATLVGEKMPGYQIRPEVTGGPKENIDRIVAGEDDLGLASLSWASDAITGQGQFGRPQPIRAIARLYLNYVQVVVRSGITDLTQLRGKEISTGSAGSTGELAASRLLTFAGLDIDKDTRRQKASLDKSVELMKQGRLDAIFWSGGLPTSGVQDALSTLGQEATVLDLGGYYQRMSVQFPDVYEEVSINPAGYGLPAPIRTIAEPNLLLVGDAMPEPLARQLTATLLGNLPQLASVHPEGRTITRARAARTDPVPLHAGALHWYRDNPVAAG